MQQMVYSPTITGDNQGGLTRYLEVCRLRITSPMLQRGSQEIPVGLRQYWGSGRGAWNQSKGS